MGTTFFVEHAFIIIENKIFELTKRVLRTHLLQERAIYRSNQHRFILVESDHAEYKRFPKGVFPIYQPGIKE